MVITVKFVKSIGLFFVIPMISLCLGVCLGYLLRTRPELKTEEDQGQSLVNKSVILDYAEANDAKTVVSGGETLCVETEYVLEEMDSNRGTCVETTWRLPEKYVGMNREQFIEAIRLYEVSPPLSELERGFQSLEVRSFSRQKVVVRMNYSYLQPGEGYYLAVYDNKVVVLLDDCKTVYIETQLTMDQLPQEVQERLIRTIRVDTEQELYDFLETYSS